MTVTTAADHGIEAMAAAHGAAVHPGTAAGAVAHGAAVRGIVAGAVIAIMVAHLITEAAHLIMEAAHLTTEVASLTTADTRTTAEMSLHPLLHLKLHNTRQ